MLGAMSTKVQRKVLFSAEHDNYRIVTHIQTHIYFIYTFKIIIVVVYCQLLFRGISPLLYKVIGNTLCTNNDFSYYRLHKGGAHTM